MISTIETRLKLNDLQESEIDLCILLWSQFYRKIWKLWNHQKLSETEIYHQIKGLNLLTSEQIGSLIYKVKAKHNKIKDLTKVQYKQKQSKLEQIEKFIVKKQKIIDKYKKEVLQLKSSQKLDYQKIAKLNQSIHKKQLVLASKKMKIHRLTKSIRIIQQRIKSNTFKLCFGSSELLRQRPGSHTDKFRMTKEQKIYDTIEDWKKDWDLARNNIWYSVGRASKPQGNAEIQYIPGEKKLRLRLTEEVANIRLSKIAVENNILLEDLLSKTKYSSLRMKARFIEIEQVEFCLKNQLKISQALEQKKPITAKIIKKLSPNNKDIGYYLQLSFDEVIRPIPNIKSIPLTMGIDLNQKGLAYCIVKADGNKLSNKDINCNSLVHKSFGFIQWNLENKSQEQRQWLISNAITEALKITQEYGVQTIAIENLDFSSTINTMNSGYKTNQKYNKMLTQFAQSLFQDLIKRKTERLNLKLALVNPTFSSIGGFTKYGLINKLPADLAASLWLARQAIFGVSFKEENHIRFIKKYKEEISLPYFNLSKQRKREINYKPEWRDISSALGKNRKFWYQNIMNFIQLKVDESLSFQNFNPFEKNQSPLA